MRTGGFVGFLGGGCWCCFVGGCFVGGCFTAAGVGGCFLRIGGGRVVGGVVGFVGRWIVVGCSVTVGVAGGWHSRSVGGGGCFFGVLQLLVGCCLVGCSAGRG